MNAGCGQVGATAIGGEIRLARTDAFGEASSSGSMAHNDGGFE